MATWFAQNSGVNIDSVNLWNSAANGSGSWLTWASLGAADVLVANGKTSIAINVNVTCGTITTAATGGTAGGGFMLSDGVTVTAGLVTGTTNVITFSANSPAVANVVGNHSAVGSQFRRCILHSGSGTLNVIGNVTGGQANEIIGIEVSGAGILNVTGLISSLDAAGDPGGSAIRISGSATLNVTGNVSAGSSITSAIHRSGTGSIFVTGNVIGGSGGANAAGILSTTTALIKVIGTLTGGTLAPAVNSTGAVVVCGNQVSASNGRLAVYSPIVLIDGIVELQHTYRRDVSGAAGTARTLYTGGTNLGQPPVNKVVAPTVFGASGEYTGTAQMPSPTVVAIGVPVDNTVGSYSPSGGLDATATANAVWNAVRSGHTTAGSYGATSEWAGQLGANAPVGWINAAAIAASALNGKGDWNTVAPPNSTIASIYALLQLTDADVAVIKSAMDTLSTMLPNTDFLAGAATNEGHAVLDTAGREAIAAAVDTQLSETHGADSWEGGGAGGGLTEGQQAQLDSIQAKTNLITSGTRITIAETSGSSITLKCGDDYYGDTAKRIEITDADSSLYDLLRTETLQARSFGAGLRRDAVTGTFSRDTITHTEASGSIAAYTTIFVECSVGSDTPAGVTTYDIQITDASGRKHTPFSGQVTLVQDFKS
jgi:hypothetical protein